LALSRKKPFNDSAIEKDYPANEVSGNQVFFAYFLFSKRK